MNRGDEMIKEITKIRKTATKHRSKNGAFTDCRQLPEKDQYTPGEREMIRTGQAVLAVLERAGQEENATALRH